MPTLGTSTAGGRSHKEAQAAVHELRRRGFLEEQIRAHMKSKGYKLPRISQLLKATREDINVEKDTSAGAAASTKKGAEIKDDKDKKMQQQNNNPLKPLPGIRAAIALAGEGGSTEPKSVAGKKSSQQETISEKKSKVLDAELEAWRPQDCGAPTAQPCLVD